MTKPYILVKLTIPEDYEDVHPELILVDARINPAFEPEIVRDSRTLEGRVDQLKGE